MKKFFTLFSLTLFLGFASAQAPATYYDGTAGLSGAPLKSKLMQIISAGAIDNGYGGLYDGYPTTDTDHFYENDGSVLDMYSENPTGPDSYNYQHGQKKCGNYSSEGDCYNREHVVPQSFFGSANPMVADINFIRPTDGKVNGMRSNYPYGTVTVPDFLSKNGTKVGTSSSTGYKGPVCEPIDEFKGDIARMIFYFVTRYEDKLSGFSSGGMLGNTPYPGLTSWEMDVLLTWAAQDPVSPSEIERNNAAYTVQHNRNPYIDHPEWVQKIWGNLIADAQVPSVPNNLTVVSTNTVSANLSWDASTDNIVVSYYKIIVNGIFKKTSNSNSAIVYGLKQGTSYNFDVIAVDASENMSAQSNVASGTTLIDTIPPSAPTSLAVANVGTNSIALSWTAATDNVEVDSYDVYANSVLMGSTNSTSINVSNLEPLTSYTLYVIAKDAAGNASAQSNSVNATTLAVGTNCGDENFDTIPPNSGAYSTNNWTNNGISWTSEDSRTDQMLNGRAITIRNGSLTALSVPNGIKNLTVTTQLKFTGTTNVTNNYFQLFINGNDTGKIIPYNSDNTKTTTTTITDLNVSGTVEIMLVQKEKTKNRVAIDDMTWTCYATAGTSEVSGNKNALTIYPNPVKNRELNVSGENLSVIENAQIFDFTGKLVQSIAKPFKNSNKITLKNLSKGVYILKAGPKTAKFIVN